jgi:uncharacterized protein YecE (DUF72 family)
MTQSIFIGPAGWSYKDWEGIVYPPRGKGKPHPVEFLAQYFDLIEINTSFYGHLKPALVRTWCQKAGAANPRFLFTAKLNRAFTHSPIAVVEPTSAATIRATAEDEKEAKAGYDALAEAGRLGALLMQFPVSFKNVAENRDYLDRLLHRFRAYPLAVEVRHASWDDPETLRDFAGKGAAFCNIDQPVLGRSLAPTEHVTARLGYVRLHGRNYDQWFEHERPHDRYNYLYTEKQLEPWKQKIERIAGQTEVTFVVANNHFEGKGAVNALQLKSMLSGRRVPAPESLLRRYPVLEGRVEPDPSRLPL